MIPKKRITLFLLTALLSIALLSGCESNDETVEQTPEIFERPEFIPFPELSESIPNIDNVVLSGEFIYFSSSDALDDDLLYNVNYIYRINIDGTGLTQLTGYINNLILPPEADGANINIISLCIDDIGNIWVAERVVFYLYDFPEDINKETVSENELWQYWTFFDSFSVVRKLDNNGSEILTMDLSSFEIDDDRFEITSINLDEAGNFYVTSNSKLNVYNKSAVLLFSLGSDVYISRIIKLPSGDVALHILQNTTNILRTVDVENKKWGESISLPESAIYIFPGNDEFFVIFIDRVELFGICSQTGDVKHILSFLDNAVIANMIENILFLPDGRIMLTNRIWDNTGTVSKTDLLVIAVVPLSDLSEMVTLTLGVINFYDDLRTAIGIFNSSSTTHRIEVIQYDNFSTEENNYRGGVERLALDIITGNAPDIIETSSIPFSQWVSTGLFIDLYPFLDADESLSRSDIQENLLYLMENDGALTRTASAFIINTVSGNPDIAGYEPGWTWEEFKAVLDANPQADKPIGDYFFTSGMTFKDWIRNMMGDFVDWSSGTADFDNDSFIDMLEFFNLLPVELEWDHNDDFLRPYEMISSGRQIVYNSFLYGFRDFHWVSVHFDGNFVMKGYPTNDRISGVINLTPAMAVTVNCKDKQAAWEFVRIFFAEDYQRNRSGAPVYMFPTNNTVFNEELAIAMETPSYGGSIQLTGGYTAEVGAITQEDADKLINLISSSIVADWTITYALEDIIMESAMDFFYGSISAADAARIIQNRASIFMAELS